MNIIGIDPGKDGFVCVLSIGDPFFYPMPTIKVRKKGDKREYDVASMRAILAFYPDAMVILERQQPMPGQGVTSMFSVGYGYGLWYGLCAGLGLALHVVHARTWQAALCRDVPGDDPKGRSITVAGRLYPKVDLRASERCRVPHDGKADALLLAHYGRLIAPKPENPDPDVGPGSTIAAPPDTEDGGKETT